MSSSIRKARALARLRSFRKVSQRIFLNLLLGVLIAQITFPPAAFAPPTNHSATPVPDVAGDALTPLRLAAEALRKFAAGDPDPELALPDEADNFFFALYQEVFDRKTEKTYGPSSEDLGAPRFKLPAGTLARSLSVEAIPGGVRLGDRHSRYAHDVYFMNGANLRSFAVDNEILVLQLDNGQILHQSLVFLNELMYRNRLFFCTRGRKQFTDGDGKVIPTKLKMILRRLDRLDRSAHGQFMQLDRNEATARRIIALADARTVADLTEIVEQTRYIPLDDKLAPHYPNTADGDVAIVAGETPETERIVDIIPRMHLAEDFQGQAGVLIQQLNFLERDPRAPVQQVESATQAVVGEINAITDDADQLARIYHTQLAEPLLRLPRAAIAKLDEHGGALIADDANRDRATPEQRAADHKYFSAVLDGARQSANAWGKVPGAFRALAFRAGERWSNFDLGGKLSRLVKFIKTKKKHLGIGAAATAAVVGVDQGGFDGQGARLAIDLMNGVMFWAHNQTMDAIPVLKDGEYTKNLLLYSIPCLAAVPALVYAVGAFFSRFTNHRPAVLIVMTGIRTFARVFQANPFRLIATLTGQKAPLHALQQGDVVAPIVSLGSENRRAATDTASAQVQARLLRESLANMICLVLVGIEFNVDPGELWVLQRGGDPASRPGMEMTLEVREMLVQALSELSPEELQRCLTSNIKNVVELIKTLRGTAQQLATAGARQEWHDRWAVHARRIVIQKVIANVANYNESVVEELGGAVPDEFVANLTWVGYLVDYLMSLFTQSFVGDWANPNEPKKLHYQPDKTFYSTPAASAEAGHQTSIALGRGAATNYMVYNTEGTGVNETHRPVEFRDFDDLEKKGMRASWRQALEMVGMLLDVRTVQPFRNAYRTMVKGRVTLLQSTLLAGVLFRCLFGGQSVGDAFMGQGIFMAIAMFGFGWPNCVVYPALGIHEDRIKASYAEFKGRLVRLAQAVRLGQEDEAEAALAAVQEYAALGDLQVPQVPFRAYDDQTFEDRADSDPARKPRETAVSYGDRIVKFYLQNPRFSHAQSKKVFWGYLSAVAVATTVMATYLFSQTMDVAAMNVFSSINWFDWNISRVPDGDSLASLTAKSVIITSALLGIQHGFNTAWDYAKLQILKFRKPFDPRIPKAEATFQASKEAFVNWWPLNLPGKIVGTTVRTAHWAVYAVQMAELKKAYDTAKLHLGYVNEPGSGFDDELIARERVRLAREMEELEAAAVALKAQYASSKIPDMPGNDMLRIVARPAVSVAKAIYRGCSWLVGVYAEGLKNMPPLPPHK